jgi:hypothetical protein
MIMSYEISGDQRPAGGCEMGAREGALGRDPVVWAVQVVLVLWCLPALLLVLALGLIVIAVEAGARWTAAVIRRVVPRGRRMGAAPPRPPGKVLRLDSRRQAELRRGADARKEVEAKGVGDAVGAVS